MVDPWGPVHCAKHYRGDRGPDWHHTVCLCITIRCITAGDAQMQDRMNSGCGCTVTVGRLIVAVVAVAAP